MSILVYVDQNELSQIEVVTKAVQKAFPQLLWVVTTNREEFENSFKSYRICTQQDAFKGFEDEFDLIWPPPSRFLKNKELKEKVWEDIKTKVLSAGQRDSLLTGFSMPITESQFLQILTKVTGGSTPFIVVGKDGERIGVGKASDFLEEVDTCVSFEDIASMLAASLVFRAQQVVLRPFGSNSRGKEGAAK